MLLARAVQVGSVEVGQQALHFGKVRVGERRRPLEVELEVPAGWGLVADSDAGPNADEQGATAVEYGMMVALIAAVIVAAVVILGGKINTAFTAINNALP